MKNSNKRRQRRDTRGNSARQTFASFLVLLLLTAFSPAQSHATSPEFYQLLADINGKLKTFHPTRGPDCTVDLVDQVQNALQGELFSSGFQQVVVKPLEAGAKTAATLLGAPGAAMTAYGIMRCAMEETTAEGFYRCAGGEITGGVLGAGLGTQLPGNPAGDIAGVAFDRGWDEGFAQARAAYEAYGATSETVSGNSESGDCKVYYTFHWSKRDRGPGARGGRILFSASVRDCECQTRNEARAGHVRAFFDVTYSNHYDGPGWKIRSPRDIKIEAQCCGQYRYPDDSYLFNSAGRMVSKVSGDYPPEEEEEDSGGGSETGSGGDRREPEPPPPPPPVVLPPPELVEYSRTSPCPACIPIKQKIDETAAEISALLEQRNDKLDEKNQKLEEKRKQERKIQQLQSRLRGQGGIGAESFDPSTGLTTSSYDTGDGQVRITVTDRDGNVVSERNRESETSAAIKDKLEQAEQQLDAIDAEIETIDNAISEINAARDRAKAKYDNLQSALDDCVERLCRGYARCDQLLKHIESYRNAGLVQRSLSIYNRLVRRAREMGCFDLEDKQAMLFDQHYQLDSARVFVKPTGDGIKVKVIDVRHISGNNPYDQENPEADDAGHVHSHDHHPVSPPSGGGGADILVVMVNGKYIPIRKLSVAGPDACPTDHYHAPSAIACDGTGVIDPAPGSCGFGQVGSEFPFPLSACSNP